MLDDIKKYARSLVTEKYMVNTLSKIVAIPSTIQSPEMKKQVLSVFLEFAKYEGYDVEEHEEYGSVLLRNLNENLEVGIIVHLDVVPAGPGWNFDPFKLTQWNGLLIGRGTLDDKGPAIVALTAMKYFMYNKVSLPFSIRLFLGCDEESGMGDIEKFLCSYKAPDFSFTPDSVFPVCCGENGLATIMVSSEIGDDIVSLMGKTIVNSPSSYAKAVFSHDLPVPIEEDSLPSCIQKHKNVIEVINTYPLTEKPFNAIQLLCEHMYNNEILSKTSRKAIELILMLSATGLDQYENTYMRLSKPDYLNVRCDSIRVKDGKLITKYQVRYAALSNFNDITANLEKKIKPYNSSLTVLRNRSGLIFDSDARKTTCLLNAYQETTGDIASPFFDDYGTYAAVLPNTVAFGMRTPQPHNLLGNGRGNMHEKDEYISLEEMKIGLETYIRAIYQLGKFYNCNEGNK